MKSVCTLTLCLLALILLSVHTGSAQIPKVKFPKPKPQATPEAEPRTESPMTQPVTPSEPSSSQSASSAAQPGSGGPYVVLPDGPASPQFLPETLQIDMELWDYYWKIPNDNHNTSW